MHDYAIVVCARWETDSIVEWLNFHRLLGFDHAYVYCNDDDPVELYTTLIPFTQGENPFVTFHHFGLQGQQGQMYAHFLRHHLTECRHFMCFDVDEFLLLRHQRSLEEFHGLFDDPDAIHFHSVNASHNGHVERPKGLVIPNYTRRGVIAAPFTKSLVKSSCVALSRIDAAVAGAWWHDIEIVLHEEAKIIDVLRNDMTGYYTKPDEEWVAFNTNFSFHQDIIDTAFIYHIGFKSEMDFRRRIERGTSGDFHLQVTWGDQTKDYLDTLLKSYDVADEHRLVELTREVDRKAFDNQIVKTPVGLNLALRKPSDQSSTCEQSRHPETSVDASQVVNGRPRGLYGHHTQVEESPWWTVDLEAVHTVREVHVFNRVDSERNQLRNFMLSASLDGLEWHQLHTKHDDVPFGGVDGTMYVWMPPEPVRLRHLRVTGIGLCALVLDQVAIYA